MPKSKIKERGSAVYQLFLLALSVYVLAILLVEAFVDLDNQTSQVFQYIDFFVCLFFLVDFILNLAYAQDRMGYLKWGWIDLISSIPAIDPLRWGRLSRVVRILRFLRSIKSLKLLTAAVKRSKLESLTLFVAFFAFLSFSLSAALILEFERGHSSGIDTASEALTWCALNLFNAKISVSEAKTTGGMAITILLNKVGLLLFAYLNAIVVAWLLQKRSTEQAVLEEPAKVTDSSK